MKTIKTLVFLCLIPTCLKAEKIENRIETSVKEVMAADSEQVATLLTEGGKAAQAAEALAKRLEKKLQPAINQAKLEVEKAGKAAQEEVPTFLNKVAEMKRAQTAGFAALIKAGTAAAEAVVKE